MRWLQFLLLALTLARLRRMPWPCSPTKFCRPGARSARARALEGAALHGLPEPVDRRFGCAAGARPADPGARTAQGRRQRSAGDRFSGRALRRVRAAQAALSSHTALLWLMPAAVFVIGALALVLVSRRYRSRTALAGRDPASSRAAEEARLSDLLRRG